MAESALLAHIVSQTKANVSFLAAHNHITQADASTILGRLDAVESRGVSTAPASALANAMQNLSVNPTRESTPAAVSPPVAARRDVPTPPSRTQKAKALWAYNEDGQESNDLSFSAGEIIEIIDETNADWWTGKCRGKQGLFPSNHVVKIEASAAPPVSAAAPVHAVPPAPAPSSYGPPAWSPPGPMPPMPMPSQPPYPMSSYEHEKSAPYPPYGAPPPGPSYGAPPGAPAPVVVEGHKDKKKKFGGDLGKTMATAAAGGVGFGAGAAIGGGIIDAIF